MLNKLLAFIRQYDLLQPGDRVVCGVSGGADSVAMLFGLYLLKEKLGLRLEAAHFNHHLRGEESDRDEAFVADLCARYEIPLHLGGTQVLPGEKGLEAAAREARYAFFEGLPGKIATAHTCDDNAETVLMHLVRGTGLKGLGGISPVRGRIIRPMLGVSRQEVLAFLQEYHLNHVCDSSNETDDFLRNRLRHHVVPLLRRENPEFAANTSAMALSLRQDEAVLEAMAREEKSDVNRLRTMPEALRRRTLAAFLKSCGVREPERRHIARLENLVFSKNPSAWGNFPGNIIIRRCYDTLERVGEGAEFCVSLEGPGEVEIPGFRLAISPAQEYVNTPNRFTIPALPGVQVRSRRSGDSLRTYAGTKTLKKLFIDRKIPAHLRNTIPVVATEDAVLGVWSVGANLESQNQEPGWVLDFSPII